MKRLTYLLAAVFVVLGLFPTGSAFAQKSLPKAPISYPGDTDQTIIRRAQWIEGARKEGKLVWWGVASPREKQEIVAEFSKVYPFIKVDHWRGGGEEIASKLEAEHPTGRFSVDLTQGGEPFNYPRWRKIGLMGKFTDIVPGIRNIDKRMYSKFGDWAQPGNNGVTPQYNTKLVSAAEAPKSWEDLLDPKWKKKIGIPEASVKHWAAMALADGGWGLEKTEVYLRKLKEQDIIWGRGYSATHSLLIAGEFKVSAHGYVYHVFQSKEKGASVEWCRVNPVLVTGPAFTMVQNGPHPNAARLFLEWLLSPQGLLIWDKITNNGAAFPGAGTRTSKALEGLNLIYRTEETVLKMAEPGVIDRIAAILGVSPGAGD